MRLLRSIIISFEYIAAIDFKYNGTIEEEAIKEMRRLQFPTINTNESEELVV